MIQDVSGKITACIIQGGRRRREKPRIKPAAWRSFSEGAASSFHSADAGAAIPVRASAKWRPPPWGRVGVGAANHPRWRQAPHTIYIHLPRYPVCIAILTKPCTALHRLTGHPEKWRSHFSGKPAPYKSVLSSAARLVQNFVSIAISAAPSRLKISRPTTPLAQQTTKPRGKNHARSQH